MAPRFNFDNLESAAPAISAKEAWQSKPSARRYDGWSSIYSGMGVSGRDKRTGVYYSGADTLSIEEWISQYTGDGLVRRLIDLLPEDMTREWGYFQNDPTDEYDEGLLSYHMNRLSASSVFREAKKWARLTGGALVYIGAIGAGSPKTELTPERMKRIKSIEFLKVFDLGDITTSECVWDTNANSPTFGQILIYRVKVRIGDSFEYADIHASRCIPFFGERVPQSATSTGGSAVETRYWGIPALQYMYDDIKDFRAAFSNTATILQEFIVGKYKFADLDEMLASGNESRLKTRIDAIELSKSSINAVLLGSDEEYSRDAATVTGIPDLLDRFMMLLSSSSGYPVTKLFGRSAGGLNATGEGDQAIYYDAVHSQQRDLTNHVNRFGMILASWLNVDGDISWIWNPLTQLTEEQKNNAVRIEAESERTKADAFQRMILSNVLSPDEVRLLGYQAKLDESYAKVGKKAAQKAPEPEPVVTATSSADPKATKAGQDPKAGTKEQLPAAPTSTKNK